MTDKADPFGEVKATVGGKDQPSPQHSPASTASEGRHVSPVPAKAPAPDFGRRGDGKPSATWTYRGAGGAILGYVARFDAGDGKKVLPLTLWQDGAALRWHWKQFPSPRPLYRLDQLLSRPRAPVLVVEGEKTADAAAAHFPDMVVVTWPGGSKACGKVDWQPLTGRSVVIFPDADKPGRQAADTIAAILKRSGGVGAVVIDLPADLPEGWDMADAWPSGFGAAEAGTLVAGALDQHAAPLLTMPFGYSLTPDGLMFEESGKEGARHQIRLADTFEILGEARDTDGGGWSVVIRFRDRDDRIKTEVIPRAMLASEPGAVRARLAGEGLFIKPNGGRADRFSAFLSEVACSTRLTLSERTGWLPHDRFVLPNRVIGPAQGEAVHFTGSAASLHYRQKGSAQGWADNVAALAVGNPLLLFAISTALAGPLLRHAPLEGGGFHFRGPSSCGKTSLALAAGSVWGGGGPLGAGQSWRATANALEMIAFGHSETVLVLDELALVAAEEAGPAAYALATGQGKARSKTDGALRKRSEWLVMILSTGEIGLADHIRASKSGGRPMAGQELRLLDIVADGGAGMGAWCELHYTGGAAEFSDSLKAACGQHYGFAGPAFVEHLVQDMASAKRDLTAFMAQFQDRAAVTGDTGQVHRAALRFALVAAAGEMACQAGVVPWVRGDAADAALELFKRWASSFGRAAPREQRDIVVVIRGAIEQQGSRFAALTAPEDLNEPCQSNRVGEARSLTTLGFRQVRNGEELYLFHDAGWREVLKGFDPAYAARTLVDAGLLLTGDGKHMKRKVKTAAGVRRLYTVKGSILETDLTD